MLSQLLTGGKDALVSILLSIPVILFSLSFHEAAHGFIADKMGDHTAKNLGRVTLNPLKHLDPIGAICMLIFGYGWAKPVPINTRNFNNARKGMAITGIAGPISNLILGAASTVVYVILNLLYLEAAYSNFAAGFLTFIEILVMLFYVSSILNFGLMAFNLIPVPPFDGSRFFYYFLPQKWYFKVMQHEQIIMIVVLVGFFALSRIGYSPVSLISNWLFDSISTPLWEIGTKLMFGW